MAIAMKECNNLPYSEPLLQSFSRLTKFPVCPFGKHVFQQQASRKTSSGVNSQWFEKKEN